MRCRGQEGRPRFAEPALAGPPRSVLPLPTGTARYILTDSEHRARGRRPPTEGPGGSRPGADIRTVWGHDDSPLYRMRIGDYRLLYFVLEKDVRVNEILHRFQAYRGLD